MRQPLTVKFIDGREVEVVAGPGELVAFERKFDLSAAAFALFDEENDTGETPKLEWFFYLAYCAYKRTNPEFDDFDSFLDAVDDVAQPKKRRRPTKTDDPPKRESPVSPPSSK